MMGEPLEVPQQQEQQHQNIHQQQTTQSLIPPSTIVEDCWDSQQSSRSSSSSALPLVPISSSSFGGGQGSSLSTSGAKGPRRTRHRVDAGEPRGCFNSANNSSFFQPRNIFTSPISSNSNNINNSSSNSGRGQHSTNSAGAGGSPLNTNSTNSPSLNSSSSPYHNFPHHPLNHQFNPQHLPGYSPHNNNSLQGSGHFNPNPAGLYGSSGGQKGQDAYYFQPMKMLSEFISTQQAAAAAAAAVAASAGNSASSVLGGGLGSMGVNGQQFPGGVVPPNQQLLLREMLSKSNGRNNANNNNNNLPTKCGYEEDVVMDGDGDQQTQQKSGEKAEVGGGNLGIKDEELEGQSSTAGDSGAEDGNLDGQLVKVETGLLDSNSKLLKSSNGQSLTSSSSTSTSSGKSVTTTTSTSGMRINGCKKRKLYQPQQRSDFDEAEEEELDDEDYDANVLEAAMARSRQKGSPPILSDSPLNPPTELVHDEEDEEEEMRLMDEKEDFDENFDDDDDDDLVTSNRTTPNNNNNNNNIPSNLVMHNNSRAGNNTSGLPASAAAAPLTRQLLTERSSNEQKPSSLSLLRTSSSPKIVLNSNGNRENMRRRDEIMNHFDHNVPFGANPQAYFLTWKENFKSTLITHITDLVDSQFSLLFPGQSQGQGGGNHNIRENNHRDNNNRVSNTASLLTPLPHRDSHHSHLQNHHHHNHQGSDNKGSSRGNSMERTTPQKNPASLLLNGGTVCNNNINNNNNNNNNNNMNNNTREKLSPPAEKIPKLDLRGNKNNDFHGPPFPRYPFQVHPGNVNNASLPTGREQNGPVKGQNFSSALMGLSQAAQMQHHAAAAAAAAAAAGLSADMFDDGPLSLVVRGHNHETPRKKRHKVTDTRLTPRAVSRLLGQVENYGDHHSSGGSPSRRDLDNRGVTPPPNGPSSGGSGGQANLPQSLPTSVAIPNPSLNDSRLFTPYAPLFHHHPGHPGHHRLDSPPMGTSLIHPALLANPAEYVQQLRAEMSREERNADLRESRDHIRAVRDSGSISCGGGPGSAGSDSGETNSYADLPGSLYSCGTTHSSSTLTPMHLRKAKLMFFWVRYPSSSVIKMYFPDIKFNKNNTAQLVKWFSNFREFYYIQMEKYARQALSEGIKNAEDLHVTTDNELYRVLNLHYNRNNHIEVPTNFRFVVEQTLREFFKAIQQGKDQEQSWKKAIYKIIARLDDPVPEYFKSPNFLEQLE